MVSRDTVVYSVVVPVYNSAPLTTRLYGRLVAVMESLGQRFELIFIDDCSTDASWTALAEIARTDRRVIAIQLARNVGQGRATLYGLDRSSGKIIITLDDDLQYAPEDIPKLLAALDGPARYDVVFGVPVSRRHPAWRRFASWMLNLVVSLVLRKPLYLRFTAFCALRRGAVLQLLAVRSAEPFLLSALLFQITRRIVMVQVQHSNSELSFSRYSLGELAQVTFGCLASLSATDRRSFTMGTCAGGLGLLTLAWSVISLCPPRLAIEG